VTRDRLRVLFVTHAFPRVEGDVAGSFLLRLARALADEHVDVSVLAPAGTAADGAPLPAHERVGGVEVRRFRYAPRDWETLAYTGTMVESVRGSARGKLALGGLLSAERRAVAHAVRDTRADVVHAHWWFPNALAAAGPARRAGIPLVVTSHGTDLRLLERTPAAAPLARYAFRRADMVTCVSAWLAQLARPFTPGEPIVAPMPADTSVFTPDGVRSTNALLFVGRLSEQKGIIDAIEALAKARRTDATLDVVGDGPLRTAVHERVQQLGLAQRVRFHASMPPRELAAFYRRASALVVPSSGEGLGLVAVEAQLCATPVVAYDSGGLPDVVQDDASGLLVRPGDVDALATAVDRVLDDGALAARLGATGRQRALARFSPPAAARAYADIYHDAVALHAA
jgi:glycosyltransferase involved in cell wall biosynthesis